MDETVATSPAKTNLNYERTIVYQTTDYEVVSCTWNKGAYAAPHAHGISQCHVVVLEGEFQNTFYLDTAAKKEVYKVGQVISTPLGTQHDILCLSETGKTLHIYSPKL